MLTPPKIPKEDFEGRFSRAIDYFRERGHVIFANESVHFWERHGFVQQSLAKLLTEHGVSVTWYDAFGWRPFHPVFHWNSPDLAVKGVFRFPGDRFQPVRRLNDALVASVLRQQQMKSNGKAIFWVHASLSESVIKKLPWVDVFSVFDDPYRHSVGDPLLERVKLITCQNDFAMKRLGSAYPQKTLLLFPPFQVDSENYNENGEVRLPLEFPKKRMGYIGTFTEDATDFGLVEYLLKNAPEWGIVFAGRTNAPGLPHLERLKTYRNFAHFDWMPAPELAALWRSIHVTILPYRNARINDGAFPVKVLESFLFDIPVVGTAVPKTSSLEGYIRREVFADRFLRAVEEEYANGYKRSGDLCRYFSDFMDPKLYLIRVSEHLRTCSSK